MTLIYPEFKAGKKTGRLLAEIASRYFCDIDERPDLIGWRMTGEPDHGMVWTEDTESYQGESVWAWKPMENIEIAELPEGVEEIIDDLTGLKERL